MRRESATVAHNVLESKERWILLAILVLGLALRVGLVRIDRIVRWDEPDYLILGRNLFTGHGYTVIGKTELHYAPLFPIAAGVLYPLTQDMKLNSDMVYVFFGVLLLVPFFWLSKELYGRRIALVATTLLCVSPPLTSGVLFWGTMLEPLYLFLLFAALAAAWYSWRERRLPGCAAMGALFGLAYLAKPEAIVNLAAILAWLTVAHALRRMLLTRHALAGLALALAGFALVIAPYLTFMYRHTGSIMITGKLGVTYVAGQGAVEHDPGLYDRALSRLDAAGDEIIWFSADRFKYDIAELITADPGAFLWRIWQNVNILERVLFARQVFPFYLLALVGLGWFGASWNRGRAIKELFLMAAALPVVIFLPFHIELRYFAPMLPILLLWVAKGIDAFASWLQQTWDATLPGASKARVGTVAALGLTVLVAALFLVMQPSVIADGLEGLNPSRRDAGLWLNVHSDPGALIMSRDTEVPFFAERRWAATPNEDYERFIAYVRKRGAQYVVVDEREVTVIRPQLSFLADPSSTPPELKHAYTAQDRRGNTIVYEVLP